MAFKATSAIPARAYGQAKHWAIKVSRECQTFSNISAAGSVGYDFIGNVRESLSGADAVFDRVAAVPGILQYARDQEGDQDYNVGAEFAALMTVVQSVIDWIDATVPTNVTALPPSQWTGSDTKISTTFTPAQTTQLRVRLAAIVAAVE